MEDITITLEHLAWGMGFLITTSAAAKVVHSWFKPIKRLKEDIASKVDIEDFEKLKDELETSKKELETLKDYQNEDHDRLKTLEKGNEAICKCILAITDHELTGNSVDKLKQAKEEMQNYLIEK